MATPISASVIRHVMHDIKHNHSGQVDDAHGQMLASLGAEELQIFQAASELVARRAVKKITAIPSRRSFFRVESLHRYHHQREEETFAPSQPFDVSMVSGSGPNYYNCFEHYCSCSAFHETTVQEPTAMCKHMVAILLADATNQYATITVKDLEFAKMLCPLLEPVTDHE